MPVNNIYGEMFYLSLLYICLRVFLSDVVVWLMGIFGCTVEMTWHNSLKKFFFFNVLIHLLK